MSYDIKNLEILYVMYEFSSNYKFFIKLGELNLFKDML